ncbi:hypothetical protein HMPREF9151_02361 [Hoylesella saccharolytica F0055]|uniref:Uncharacterized protein n=1 Tax=Hoylesella saccharolytica F0055 TaxID=1127699 RepID=L1N035_9BACT|nr:hypothetical protein HMPREF9151_02361 [Hoylesella saccharolytica F0055]
MLSEKIQTFCKDKGWWYDDHHCIKNASKIPKTSYIFTCTRLA